MYYLFAHIGLCWLACIEMAKLVASIFNEYLSVLFEDFSSKNVKDLLKEILDPVFPNIEIVQAICDSVRVHIPTLHLKS